ncbi:MAG: sigma-54-dependent Fis family transcriptional regulator [Deltaproteobacteria bacterium]|nr:sigma-54-dependent Fis family transcriptional regulator [Deltaproteobacteria bacterium]
MARTANVLIVDDNPSIRQTVEAIVRAAGMKPTVADSGEAALETLRTAPVDIVLLDVQMPGMSGLEVLKIARERHPDVGILMLSVLKDLPVVVEAMRLGAVDYVTKDFSPPELSARLQKTLEGIKDKKELAWLRSEVAERGARPFIFGKSQKLKAVVEVADKIAGTPVTVLIQGESGTGKEVLARYLHSRSDRKAGPFVAVNLANLESGLAESTLFGHERGAFTGATRLQYGKFELASGGTLFLDELAELRLDLQAKLLRALQEREIERVGGGRPIAVDVRIVCATNRDLQREVDAGRFRDDLFWRLKVVPLMLPPLRERREDVPDLAQHFLDRFCALHGKAQKTLSPSALGILENHRWPGNVRELENTMERAVLLSSGATIDEGDLPLELTVAAGYSSAAEREPTLQAALHAFERGYLRKMLAVYGGRKKECAEALGIGYSTLKAKLKQLGIGPGEFGPDEGPDE